MEMQSGKSWRAAAQAANFPVGLHLRACVSSLRSECSQMIFHLEVLGSTSRWGGRDSAARLAEYQFCVRSPGDAPFHQKSHPSSGMEWRAEHPAGADAEPSNIIMLIKTQLNPCQQKRWVVTNQSQPTSPSAGEPLPLSHWTRVRVSFLFLCRLLQHGWHTHTYRGVLHFLRIQTDITWMELRWRGLQEIKFLLILISFMLFLVIWL